MSFLHNITLFLLSKKEPKKTVKQFVSWNQLSKILIIAHDNQLNVDLVDFISLSKNDNISPHVAIIYNGKLENALKPHFEHTILDKKQFSLFQMPSEATIQKFNSAQYDVIINLGNSEQLKALALSKLVNAKCKISNFQNSIFDITMDYDKTMNSSDYLKHVVVYLNMIKTTK